MITITINDGTQYGKWGKRIPEESSITNREFVRTAGAFKEYIKSKFLVVNYMRR
jgi:hypothetical protein